MAGTIGIKIANGDFYPVLMEGNSTIKKRLVLTTVHDRQESVQIDLFRSVSKSMIDAQYIGSLLVENIKPRAKGEPSIETIISYGENGNITADASDLDAGLAGEHHILNVSLKTANTPYYNKSSADFDLESKPQVPTGLYGKADINDDDEPKSSWLIMAIATAFVIIAIGLVWFFFLGGRYIPLFGGSSQKSEQTAPPSPPPAAAKAEPVAPPPPEPPAVKAEPVAPPPPPPPPPEPIAAPKPVEEVPVIQAPTSPPPSRTGVAQRTRPPAPVSSYKVPAVIPKNGVAYQIRWGDTLWDIAEAFYRNPWLYPRIARHNNIRNPDMIIAGKTIRIPPRN